MNIMQKRYRVLLIGFVSIVVIVFMAHEQENARRYYQSQCQQSIHPIQIPFLSSDANETNQCQNAKEYMPWWYVLVSWPEGIGAWILLGTGVAIGWQSWETRKAAENSGLQLAFHKETLRPRLSISRFTNDTFKQSCRGEWVFIKMEVSNSGGMPAYGVIVDTWIEFVPCVEPYKFTSAVRYRRSAPFNVHTGVPSGFFIPLHRRLTEEERYQLAKGKGTIFFRVRLNYKAFDKDVHTDEAYIVRAESMDTIAESASAT